MTTSSSNRSTFDEDKDTEEFELDGKMVTRECEQNKINSTDTWKNKRDTPRQTTTITVRSSSSSSDSSGREKRDEDNTKTSRQYHYFYGSTATGVELKAKVTGNLSRNTRRLHEYYEDEDDENYIEIDSSSEVFVHTDGSKKQRTNSAYSIYTSNTDDNSLVGEGLLLTDQELDDMTLADDASSNSNIGRRRPKHGLDNKRLIFVTEGDTSIADESKPLLLSSKSTANRTSSGVSNSPDNADCANNHNNGTRSERRSSHRQHRQSQHHSHSRDSVSLQSLPIMPDSDFCDNRNCIRRTLLGITIAILAMLVAVLIFPTSRLAQDATTPESQLLLLESVEDYFRSIPFRIVDRGVDYDDPVSNFMDASLFHPSLLKQREQESQETNLDPSQIMPDQVNKNSKQPIFQFPFPTGAFWINLILPPTAERSLSYPIAVYPYGYKWSPDQVQLSYPSQHRSISQQAIHDYFFPDLSFTTVETMRRRHIIKFDALSVSLRYYEHANADSTNSTTTSNDSSSSVATPDSNGWETYLVQGSPYMTMKFVSVTPTIKAFSRFANVACPREDNDSDDSSCSSSCNDTVLTKIQQQQINRTVSASEANGRNTHRRAHERRNRRNNRNLKIGVCTRVNDSKNNVVVLTGTQFIIQTQEGMDWILFASEPVTLQFKLGGENNEIVFGNKFSGVLRVALVPASSTNDPTETVQASDSTTSSLDNRISQSTGLQRLIYHAGSYPKSGSVSWTFRDSTVEPESLSTTQITSKIVLEMMSLASPTTTVNATNTGSDATPRTTPPSRTAVGNTTPSEPYSSPFRAKSKRIGNISFKFDTDTMMSSTVTMGNKPPLLMLALPHHAQSLDPSVQLNHAVFDLVYKCIKGPMRPVLGSTWSYDEPLLAIGFDGGSGTDNDQKYLHPEVYEKIVENLRKDTKISLPTLTENIYGFGKQAARLAQLAYIASVIESGTITASKTNKGGVRSPLGQEDAELSTLKQEALTVLKELLTSLLLDKTSDSLVYDINMGGLVTSDGLIDSHADFGNGRYNDHHFHYGYILYTAAIIGKLDPSFVEEYSKQVDAIYNDIAHESNLNSEAPSDNIFFPGSRHKIWFDGHSYASGMFPFGNGKSQESSSEAVNCYYGAYLWSLVRNGAADNPELDTSARTDFARLLLATEIRGAKTYWHMIPPNLDVSSTTNKDEGTTVYTPQFSENYMIGNMGMLDALCTTWFGNSILYVHMINLIPVTAITGELFGESYASLEYKNVLEPLRPVEAAWNGFVIADRAISDPMGAWNEAQGVNSELLDSGLSKTQLLYWIATRSGFNLTTSTSYDQPLSNGAQNLTIETAKISSAACSNTPTCASTGLLGECCPTGAGVFLDCCHN